VKFDFEAIGLVHSCYKEKFAIPRQAGLVEHATAYIELIEPYNHPDIVKGLEGFSHLWVSFVFHQHLDKGWKNLVSPPRLEGQTRYGVFATRSSFRPNPMGLSVVQLNSIETKSNRLFIHISGADFLDGTPVLDIKPYISYSDSLENTRSGFIQDIKEPNYSITYAEQALQQISQAKHQYPHIDSFIAELLKIDHRPHYMKHIKKTYNSKVYEYDLQWDIDGTEVFVLSLDKG